MSMVKILKSVIILDSLYEPLSFNVLFFSKTYRRHFAIPISELCGFKLKLSTELKNNQRPMCPGKKNNYTESIVLLL